MPGVTVQCIQLIWVCILGGLQQCRQCGLSVALIWHLFMPTLHQQLSS